MLFMSDHFHHVSDQFWLCSDILSGHLLFLIGNPAHAHTHAHTCTHMHTNTHMHTHMHTPHTSTHTDTCRHTCTQTHADTQVHTHAYNGSLVLGRFDLTMESTPSSSILSLRTYTIRLRALKAAGFSLSFFSVARMYPTPSAR